MSKKKVFTGNTMTLKDFHGGSIPSDLPLPSAPGVVARPSDRPGYDRSASWGSSVSRPDHRSRPNSSQSARHFDDKTPFPAHYPHIGRNFDEDERKPLDGVSAPRRTVSDESIQAQASNAEVKPESVSAVGRLSGWKGSAPAASPLPGGTYSGRVSGRIHVGMDSPNLGGNSGQAVSRMYPNAWVARKEVAAEPVQPVWSQESAVSKLAHASALEKVSTGRWQMKHSIHYQTDAEVVIHSEPENNKGSYSNVHDDKGFNRVDEEGGREHHDAVLASHVGRSSNIHNRIQSGRKESLLNERARTPVYSEVKERNPRINIEGIQPIHSDRKVGGPELQPVVPSESSERPKLMLLPRKKPLGGSEPPIVDHHQACQRPADSVHDETENKLNGNVSIRKPGSASTDSGNPVLERPKLNLKPRSQPLEKQHLKIEGDRTALFGGARPREMVLKERGIDEDEDDVINNDVGQDSDRTKHTERVSVHTARTRHSDKNENPPDQRMEKKFERKDQRVDGERVDTQSKNWRSENWRNSKEIESQSQPPLKHHQERQPSPETWRKPVEQQPAAFDGLRHGKAASALELAQAFSRSVSEPKMGNRLHSSERSYPGRPQMPFSRLMGPTPQRQINGY